MSTFLQLSQLRCADLLYWLTIEGIGSSAGLDRFCSRVPVWAARTDTTWKPWVLRDTFPDHLPESVPALGGVAELGAIGFTLLDGVGCVDDAEYNYLTKRLGTDTQEDLRLDTSTPVGTTSGIDVKTDDAATLALVVVGAILFVGAEAWEVLTAVPNGLDKMTISVTRAALDTEEALHDVDDSVYLQTPYIDGRIVRLYLGYDDPGFSIGEAREAGPGWAIESFDPSEGLQCYEVNTTSGRGLVDRVVNRKQWKGLLASSTGSEGRQLQITPHEGALDDAAAVHFDGRVWMRHGKEIFLVDWPTAGRPAWQISLARRGAVGTPIEELKPGKEIRQVFVADKRDGLGSFRYQAPGAETSSRSTGTWIATEHPIGIALCVLLSSAGDDGLDVTNYDATPGSETGNYSALPVFSGCGIPIERVNVPSFQAIWFRHPEWSLPNLVMDESIPFREFVDLHVCRPFGVVLTVKGGKLTAFEDTTAPISVDGTRITQDDILIEESDGDAARWVVDQRKARDLAAPLIKFIGKSTEGIDSEIVFKDEDFKELFGNIRGHWKLDSGVLEIPVPGVRLDDAGTRDLFERRAFRLLFRVRRAPWRVLLSTDMSTIDADVFSSILLTHPEMINDQSRARGWVDFPCRVLSKTIDIENEKIDYELLAYAASAKIGLIPPSGKIVSKAGSNFTILANRFTSADVPGALELPNNDRDGFRVGDRVRIQARDGTFPATTPSYQTIVSLGVADRLDLDGDFGGSASGVSPNWLVYADYDETTEQQKDYVHLARAATLLLGTAEDDPYAYGEGG